MKLLISELLEDGFCNHCKSSLEKGKLAIFNKKEKGLFAVYCFSCIEFEGSITTLTKDDFIDLVSEVEHLETKSNKDSKIIDISEILNKEKK